MIDALRRMLLSQYEATLSMLADCVTHCDEATWQVPVARLQFNQVAFHVLFYMDLYLDADVASFCQQAFHQEHATAFGDYEELEPRVQQQAYSKDFLRHYLSHCREKAAKVISAETSDSLAVPVSYDWLDCSRLELHFYNVRHLQHHAAQLSLRLRLDSNLQIPWVKSGWQEPGNDHPLSPPAKESRE